MLHQWQRLATPNLGGIFEEHPGIAHKGERNIDLDTEIYTLSDIEEDGMLRRPLTDNNPNNGAAGLGSLLQPLRRNSTEITLKTDSSYRRNSEGSITVQADSVLSQESHPFLEVGGATPLPHSGLYLAEHPTDTKSGLLFSFLGSVNIGNKDRQNNKINHEDDQNPDQSQPENQNGSFENQTNQNFTVASSTNKGVKNVNLGSDGCHAQRVDDSTSSDGPIMMHAIPEGQTRVKRLRKRSRSQQTYKEAVLKSKLNQKTTDSDNPNLTAAPPPQGTVRSALNMIRNITNIWPRRPYDVEV